MFSCLCANYFNLKTTSNKVKKQNQKNDWISLDNQSIIIISNFYEVFHLCKVLYKLNLEFFLSKRFKKNYLFYLKTNFRTYLWKRTITKIILKERGKRDPQKSQFFKNYFNICFVISYLISVKQLLLKSKFNFIKSSWWRIIK